jgi:hypothetical protein
MQFGEHLLIANQQHIKYHPKGMARLATEEGIRHPPATAQFQ